MAVRGLSHVAGSSDRGYDYRRVHGTPAGQQTEKRAGVGGLIALCRDSCPGSSSQHVTHGKQ